MHESNEPSRCGGWRVPPWPASYLVRVRVRVRANPNPNQVRWLASAAVASVIPVGFRLYCGVHAHIWI